MVLLSVYEPLWSLSLRTSATGEHLRVGWGARGRAAGGDAKRAIYMGGTHTSGSNTWEKQTLIRNQSLAKQGGRK